MRGPHRKRIVAPPITPPTTVYAFVPLPVRSVTNSFRSRFLPLPPPSVSGSFRLRFLPLPVSSVTASDRYRFLSKHDSPAAAPHVLSKLIPTNVHSLPMLDVLFIPMRARARVRARARARVPVRVHTYIYTPTYIHTHIRNIRNIRTYIHTHHALL